MMRLKWRQKYLSTTMSGVPDKPGLYAYGKVRAICDLEKSRSIVYVGQTDNLQRRLRQHLPRAEENRLLREYLRNEKNIICWYCPLDHTKRERLELERQMIERFKPKFNSQHNS